MNLSRFWVALLLLLAACGPVVSSTPSASPALIFGRITAIDDLSLTVEKATFFTGKAAADAAREDGQTVIGDDMPNGFYIRDLDAVQVISLAPGADISVLGYDADGNPSPIPYDVTRLATAIDAWSAGTNPPDLYWSD